MKNRQIEIFQRHEFSKIAKALIKYCDGIYDSSSLMEMIADNDRIIKEYDWKNRRVSNLTKQEIDAVFISLRRRVVNTHCRDSEGYIIRDKRHGEFVDAVQKTVLPEYLIHSKILLRRKSGKIADCDRMEREVNEMLLNEMYKCFSEQNEKLITKYNKYDTSE